MRQKTLTAPQVLIYKRGQARASASGKTRTGTSSGLPIKREYLFPKLFGTVYTGQMEPDRFGIGFLGVDPFCVRINKRIVSWSSIVPSGTTFLSEHIVPDNRSDPDQVYKYHVNTKSIRTILYLFQLDPVPCKRNFN